MKERTTLFIDQFFVRHPEFLPLQDPILKACHMLIQAFRNGNKLLLCGNGGSCADCDHIAHVNTQLPYAMVVAGVTFVGYILAGFVQNAWVVLPVSVAMMAAVLLVIRSMQNKKAA